LDTLEKKVETISSPEKPEAEVAKKTKSSFSQKNFRLFRWGFVFLLLYVTTYPLLATRIRSSILLSLVLGFAIIILLWLSGQALWFVPKWQIASIKKRRDGSTSTREQQIHEASADPEMEENFSLENEARKTLAQILGGVFLLLGLFFTAENLKITQENLEKTQKLTERGQVTDRFTKAIEKLGAKEIEFKLGGIYALEKIAQDDPDGYYFTVMDVLTAYVRNHASYQESSLDKKQPAVQIVSAPNSIASENKNSTDDKAISTDKPLAEIQVVLSVIGRCFGKLKDEEKQRILTQEKEDESEHRIDLTNSNLEKVKLNKSDFSKADLSGAVLNQAILDHPNLNKADLSDAKLNDAILNDAQLFETIFNNAELNRVTFINAKSNGAYFEFAKLNNAKLNQATLNNAHFYKAQFNEAYLSKTILIGADFSNAILNKATLNEANLSNAKLNDADFSNAILNGADFSNAYLKGTILSNANLSGADLSTCKYLTWEQIDSAIIDENTKLPPEFDAQQKEKLRKQKEREQQLKKQLKQE
jgi:uncharacterized protein YjbI with pentapeptide repeats